MVIISLYKPNAILHNLYIMTNEQKAAHLSRLKQLAENYERKVSFTVTDVTPTGYGPGPNAGELPEMIHLTTEEQAQRRSRCEADTIQRARKAGR